MSAVDGVPSEILQTEAFVCNDPQAQRIAELERTCDLRGAANWVLSEENDRLEAENARLRDLVGKTWDHVAAMNGMDLPQARNEYMEANGLGEG